MRKNIIIQHYLLYGIMLFLGIINGQNIEQKKAFERRNRLYSGSLERVHIFASHKDITAYTFSMGYGTFIFKNIAFYGLLDVMDTKGVVNSSSDTTVERMDAETFGLGASMLFRGHLVRFKRVGLFMDVGAGTIYAFENFPPEGTKFNFTAKFGGGIVLDFNKHLRLIFGVNRFHISNGKGGDHPRNPNFDGTGGTIGIVFHSGQTGINIKS